MYFLPGSILFFFCVNYVLPCAYRSTFHATFCSTFRATIAEPHGTLKSANVISYTPALNATISPTYNTTIHTAFKSTNVISYPPAFPAALCATISVAIQSANVISYPPAVNATNWTTHDTTI